MVSTLVSGVNLETGVRAAIVGALAVTESIDSEDGRIAPTGELGREPKSAGNLCV